MRRIAPVHHALEGSGRLTIARHLQLNSACAAGAGGHPEPELGAL
jgi:hypothetical protein